MTNRGYDQRSSGSFSLDRAYFRDQARQAAKIFVAPLTGVYHAINPSSVKLDGRNGGNDAN